MSLLADADECVGRYRRANPAHGQWWFDAERHRHRGELLRRPSAARNDALAESCFLRPLDVSREQRRGCGSCAPRPASPGCGATTADAAEARELLARVYGWFTEGFDTADLKDAKWLLDELALRRDVEIAGGQTC
jgi:hypothetical protein